MLCDGQCVYQSMASNRLLTVVVVVDVCCLRDQMVRVPLVASGSNWSALPAVI